MALELPKVCWQASSATKRLLLAVMRGFSCNLFRLQDNLQHCEEDIWDSCMQQFASLAEEAATDIEKMLPEEALTQIYQAGLYSLSCIHSQGSRAEKQSKLHLISISLSRRPQTRLTKLLGSSDMEEATEGSLCGAKNTLCSSPKEWDKLPYACQD